MRLRSLIPSAVLIGAGLFAGWSLRGGSTEPLRQTHLDATILQQVRALGDLHTVRFAYNDVFRHESARQPATWSRWVPGAEALVRGATVNRMVGTSVGTVEAGIDLKRATIRREPGGYVVAVPAPEMYEPNVRLKIHEAKRGWFWTDYEAPLYAEADVKARLRVAAERQGILEQAWTEGSKRLTALLAPFGRVRLERA